MSDQNHKEIYSSFLRQLDDSGLLSHIHSLSQEPRLRSSFNETSTPRRQSSLIKSADSDPFNDNLDSFLLRLPEDGGDTDDDAEKPPENVLIRDEIDERNNTNEAVTDKPQDPADIAITALSDLGVPCNQLAHDENVDDDNHEEIQIHKNLSTEESEDDNANTNESNFGAVGPLHEFGDFATYFENKHKKQQLADEAFVTWEQQRLQAMGESPVSSKIFSDCVIFVNGSTDPSWGVIHKLTILHGGKFISHLSNKGAATHIICDRLTPKKRIEFRNYKVVKAKWITDCVKENKLLDWRLYRLIDDVDFDQNRLGFNTLNIDNDYQYLEADILTEIPKINDLTEINDLEAEHGDDTTGELKYFREDIGVNTELANDELLDDDIVPDGQKAVMACSNESSVGQPSESPQLSQLNNAQERSHTAPMDAKHPEFLKHFFANSRLHHLSSWKADLRAKFLRLVAKLTPNNPNVSQSTSIRRVVLHIDFDCFFVQASALAHPNIDIWKDPIAVSHGGKSSDIASCNYAARKMGVSNGMWLGTALNYCPELRTIDYDFEAYETKSNKFYQYLTQRKIFDSIFPVLIDEVLVEMTSFCAGESKENIVQICETIREDIFKETGCTISIGISHNVLLAKLAIKKAKPNGCYYLNENLDEFLDQTRMMDLPGLGYNICEKLVKELDLETSPKSLMIKQVKPLSQKKLINNLGEKTGKKVFDFCRGIDETKIFLDTSSSEALLGRKSVSVDVNFGIRFDTFAQAEIFIMRLAQELHSRLIALGVCASVMTLKLAKRRPGTPINPPKYMGLGIVDFFNKLSRLGVPTNDWGILGSEMKSLFRILNIPVKELRGISVSMSNLEGIEVVKQQKQRRLQFNNRSKREYLPPLSPQSTEHAVPVINSDSIDWTVFNQLPDDIRRELKKELLRRGIPVSSKELSPVKLSPNKKDGKIYYQQLFPTQPNGEFKIARIIESPSKRRKTGNSPKKTLPTKRSSPTPYSDSVSYDNEVLNEIPTFIRDEFLEDLERRRRNKQLNFVSVRKKLDKHNEGKKQYNDLELSSTWFCKQSKLLLHEKLENTQLSYQEMCQQSCLWVKETLSHRGPHPDDVAIFTQYLIGLVKQGSLNRSLNLLKVIDATMDKESSKLKVCPITEDERKMFQSGLEDWRSHYEKTLNAIKTYCKACGIDVYL